MPVASETIAAYFSDKRSEDDLQALPGCTIELEPETIYSIGGQIRIGFNGKTIVTAERRGWDAQHWVYNACQSKLEIPMQERPSPGARSEQVVYQFVPPAPEEPTIKQGYEIHQGYGWQQLVIVGVSGE